MCDDCNYSEVLEQIEGALVRLKSVPSRGADFADSVEATLLSMKARIEGSNHCSDKMETAVTNIVRGIRKWTPDYEDAFDD